MSVSPALPLLTLLSCALAVLKRGAGGWSRVRLRSVLHRKKSSQVAGGSFFFPAPVQCFCVCVCVGLLWFTRVGSNRLCAHGSGWFAFSENGNQKCRNGC